MKTKDAFVCDFETQAYTTEQIDKYLEDTGEYPPTWVWLWGAVRVKETGTHTDGDYFYGNSIESFIEWAFQFNGSTKFYFHNLKFDGQFILSYLLDKKEASVINAEQKPSFYYDGPFAVCPVISDMGMWYSLTCYIYDHKTHKYKTIAFYDSLKLLNFPVAKIAKDFACSSPKGECDYTLDRPLPYNPTEEEIDYCLTDCKIVAEALHTLFTMGVNKSTIASSAKSVCKGIVSAGDKKLWDRFFPELSYDEDAFVRRSYKGGFTFVNPYYQGMTIVRKGFVLDVNSMYPGVMEYKALPYGRGVQYTGKHSEWENAEEYPFFFQRIICNIKLKDGGVPFVQNTKAIFNFSATYTAEAEDIELVLARPDFEMLFENYEVYEIEYVDGIAYHERVGALYDYIETFAEMKRTNKGAKRALAKLLINSIYGKFGSSPVRGSKQPYFENGVVKLKTIDGIPDMKNTVYIPYASAVTSYARQILISAIRAYGMRRFAYCDTDSVHIIGEYDEQFAIDHGIEIHPSKFGAWKCEAEFSCAKYLHTKCYMERIISEDFEPVNPYDQVKAAGCPKKILEGKKISFEEFSVGFSIGGKLVPVVTRGGVILRETNFEIKECPEAVVNYPCTEKFSN